MDADDNKKSVKIIENQCFASVLQATNVSPGMLSTADFRYSKFSKVSEMM